MPDPELCRRIVPIFRTVTARAIGSVPGRVGGGCCGSEVTVRGAIGRQYRPAYFAIIFTNCISEETCAYRCAVFE